MELFTANKQWATRPDDERFESLDALYQATKAYADSAREKEGVQLQTLRAEAVDGEVQLVGRGGIPAKFTNWAFRQLAARVGAPAGYLQTLPATLAVQNLNHGLAHKLSQSIDACVNLLFHVNGSLLLRAMTSEKYERVWNWEIVERLLDLASRGWEVARPDFNTFGDTKLPLYASDHDMFAFLRHSERTIVEPGNPDGLRRGLIVSNSEVGASKLRVLRFLYRAMCGNHIIWGAEEVIELALIHRGNIRGRMEAWDAEIRRYMDSSANEDEAKIASAQRRMIAATKEEVLDAIFGKKSLGLSRKAITAGYDAVVEDQDGDPRTVWGVVQGLTRHSQTLANADERMVIDVAAGKLLEAF